MTIAYMLRQGPTYAPQLPANRVNHVLYWNVPELFVARFYITLLTDRPMTAVVLILSAFVSRIVAFCLLAHDVSAECKRVQLPWWRFPAAMTPWMSALTFHTLVSSLWAIIQLTVECSLWTLLPLSWLNGALTLVAALDAAWLLAVVALGSSAYAVFLRETCGRKPHAEAATVQAALTAAAAEYEHRLQANVRQDVVAGFADSECVVCRSNRRVMAMVPCGHVASCARCALALRDAARASGRQQRCPLCEADVHACMRVFNVDGTQQRAVRTGDVVSDARDTTAQPAPAAAPAAAPARRGDDDARDADATVEAQPTEAVVAALDD